MENLERHIQNLVARHNCVIIPGVGAFLVQNVPAAYNVDEQTFMPPHRTLAFNPQVTVDDALLVSDYIATEKATFDSAAGMMRNDIYSLRKQLARKGIVRFGKLGTFSMNIKGEISFTPDSNGIDDPENFGFEPLTIPLLSQCTEKNIVIPIKRREIGKYIASVAAIILTFLFVTPVSDSAFKRGQEASLTNFASSEQISMMQQLSVPTPVHPTTESIAEICPVEYSKTGNIILENSTAPATDKKQEPAAPIVTETPANTDAHTPAFYIIVASSPNESNARLAIQELSRKHTADYKVVKCSKRHRVAIASYPTADDAQTALAQYQQIFPDAWVLSY